MRLHPNTTLALSTFVAAVFVAVQAWYARVAYVEAQETRLLEDKLDLCFENFDAAVRLDASLRAVAPDAGLEEWPPIVLVRNADELKSVQRRVVPHLNGLEASLSKASILGALDKHRMYMADRVRGLSKRLLDAVPDRLGDAKMDAEVNSIIKVLGEFIGGQYMVFTGCRMVAEGEA